MLLSDINKMLACVPEDVFWRSQDALWDGKDYVEVSDTEYREMMSRYERKQRDDNRLSKCVELNNEGILHEKNGDVESAIKAYERNICPGRSTAFLLYIAGIKTTAARGVSACVLLMSFPKRENTDKDFLK